MLLVTKQLNLGVCTVVVVAITFEVKIAQSASDTNLVATILVTIGMTQGGVQSISRAGPATIVLINV